MKLITWEEILELAPNVQTLERAKLLLQPRAWQSPGQYRHLIWAECRTRGALRYKVAADLLQRRFFSNSPVPVKPDKYLLALLLLWADDPEFFRPAASAPEWASQGLERTAAASQIPQATAPAADTTQTLEKRIAAMSEGLPYLRQWLLDAARQGLATLQMQDNNTWESLAARLTDHKLGGLARRIRNMQQSRHTTQWPQHFSRHLAALYLWLQGFSRIDELPAPLRDELLLQGGWTPRREDVLLTPGVEDDWQVLHNVQDKEAQLCVQKTWLWGVQNGIPALLLEYVWGAAEFAQTWVPGATIRGNLHFYPGASPLRAVIGEHQPTQVPFEPHTGICTSLDALFRQFARLIALNPWMSEHPFLLCDMKPVQDGSRQWLIKDLDNHLAPLDIPAGAGLKLADFCAQVPAWIFGLWSGQSFQCLAAGRPQSNEIICF